MQCEYEDKECTEKCRDFNTCTRNPCKPINILEKIKIVLSSLESEAETCHRIAEKSRNNDLYDLEKKMLIMEEIYRGCISMIKEELGVV